MHLPLSHTSTRRFHATSDFQISKVHTVPQCLLLEDMGLIPFQGAPAEPTSGSFREANHPSFRSQHGCLSPATHWPALSGCFEQTKIWALSEYLHSQLPPWNAFHPMPSLTVLFILKDLFCSSKSFLTSSSQMRLFPLWIFVTSFVSFTAHLSLWL